MAKKYKVIYGGWYQRTFIHLAEIHEFLGSGISEIGLDQKKLKKYHGALNLKSVERKSRNLDYLRTETQNGIFINYFEDGLYSLEMESDNINSAQKTLRDYYNDRLNPAISYIFSLGAPTAGKLTDSRSHPTVVIAETKSLDTFQFPTELDPPKSQKDFSGIRVYKTSGKTLIVVEEGLGDKGSQLAEPEIFLDECHRYFRAYLNLHRKMWEDIAKIKSKTAIKGKEAEEIREQLDDFQKIINMVGNRIDQMEIFITSREIMTSNIELDPKLTSSFDLRFSSLKNTSAYSKKLWRMTEQYLNSAISNIVEIQSRSTSQGIKSLQLITSIGIISGIIGYLSRDELPQITSKGFLYLLLIIALTWLVNIAINKIYQSKRYELKSGKKINL